MALLRVLAEDAGGQRAMVEEVFQGRFMSTVRTENVCPVFIAVHACWEPIIILSFILLGLLRS